MPCLWLLFSKDMLACLQFGSYYMLQRGSIRERQELGCPWGVLGWQKRVTTGQAMTWQTRALSHSTCTGPGWWSWQVLPATVSQGKVTSQAWELSAKAEDMAGDWPTYNVAQGRSLCPGMARLGHGLGSGRSRPEISRWSSWRWSGLLR